MASKILFATSLGRLLVMVAIALSLVSLPGAISKEISLPSLHLVKANLAPNEAWYPAGPAMNSLQMVIFTDQFSETTSINQALNNPSQSSIDLSDTPIHAPDNYASSPNFYEPGTTPSGTFFEVEFNLANDFWGCSFNFGNNVSTANPDCGIQIRQGISHLVDKISFANNEPLVAGYASPIDNPELPTNGGLPTPNPCSWDRVSPEQGSSCMVGASGGEAYHLAGSSFSNGFAFNQPGLGSPDFCAAAQHFINAGLATRKDHTSCVLAGISSTVTANTVNFFIRTDNGALSNLGVSMAQEICALFGQGFVQPCAPYLTVTPGRVTAFPGFTTSNSSVNLSWGMYTAGLARPELPPDLGEPEPEHDPFDSTLFFEFNSQFVSGIPSIQQSGQSGGVCSNASTPGWNAPNYMYMCVPTYDTISYQMEYAPCLNSQGDPTSGETVPTFAACSGAPGGPYATNDFALSSAASLTGPLSGPQALTLPVPIDVTSLGNYGGNVALTASVSPIVTNGPSATLGSNPTASVSQGKQFVAAVFINVPSAAPANTYTITVTGTSGSTSHPITMTLVVTSNSATVQSSQMVLSSISAGLIAEDQFGRGAYTIPVWVSNSNFAYLSNWQRVINTTGGVANYFTFLDAYSPNPAQPGTIRQGLSQNIRSVNPYIATTVWDFMVLGNIYDTLNGGNPASGSQSLNWMTISSQTIKPATAGTLGYTPPAGTTVTYRMSLRNDLFFQNDNTGSHPARQVTAWDVVFSYLSLLATGSFQSTGASDLTGVTVINSVTFDLNLGIDGPFTPLYVGSLTILPGQYWINAGQSAWNHAVDSTISTCQGQSGSALVACYRAQFTLSTTTINSNSPVLAVHCADNTIYNGASGCSQFYVVGQPHDDTHSLLNVDTNKVTATYDPVSNGILIGSGAWEAVTNGVVGGGTGVTPCGAMVCSTVPSYTLQRYGSVSSITASGCGISDHYFRSNCTLAIWVWSGDNGDFTHDFSSELQVVRACNAVSPVPAQCVHWTKGIVGTGGSPITSVQIGAVNRFVAVNWVGGAGSSFNWNTNPPTGIAAFPPVLYDGPTTTLNPCSIDPTNGYDC